MGVSALTFGQPEACGLASVGWVFKRLRLGGEDRDAKTISVRMLLLRVDIAFWCFNIATQAFAGA